MEDLHLCTSLPSEVWELIFGFLNPEDLLTCQNLSSYWAEIVNNLPPKWSWNPWFLKEPTAESLLNFRHTPGTLFECGDDIIKFRDEVEKRTEEYQTTNPFINSTAILNWRSAREFQSLQGELPSLIRIHGSFIRKLLYLIDESVPESLTRIPEFLQQMPNLRSFTIYTARYEEKRINTTFRFPELPSLNQLRELEILDISWRFPLLLQIVSKYGALLQSLHWVDQNYEKLDQRWKILVGFCPNLINFKLVNRDVLRLGREPYPLAPLKRFAYKRWTYPADSQVPSEVWDIESVLRFARHFSVTLEMLSLYMNPPSDLEMLRTQHVLIHGISFPVVKELAIPYSFVGRLILPRVVEKFPALSRLILLDTNGEFQNRIVGAEELKQVCEPFWSLIPSSVEVITIRSRQFNAELRRHFSVFMNCTKTHVL